MTDPRPGRPRSDAARSAVLRAVDDLLVEVGYARVTVKAIAERAGVSRQTVYRWWSSPAEVLLEASILDAEAELHVDDGPTDRMAADYLQRLGEFLTRSDAGLAYRALLGAAQQDAQVAALLDQTPDPIRASALPIARAACRATALHEELETAAAALVGPVLFETLTRSRVDPHELQQLAQNWNAAWNHFDPSTTRAGTHPSP